MKFKANIFYIVKKLIINKGFKKYFTNTAWLFTEKALKMLFSLFIGIWVAKYLKPIQYGLFNYVLSLVGLFAAITRMGLDNILVRELVKGKHKENELLGTAFILKIGAGIVAVIVLTILSRFISKSNFEHILVFIIAIAFIFQPFNVIEFFFQSKVLSKYIAYSNIITSSFSAIIKIGLIFLEAKLIWFAIVVVLDNIFLAICYIYFYKNQQKKLFKWVFNIELAKILLKDSWPLILSGITFTLYTNIDKIIIKNMLGNYFVGEYAAASKFVLIWHFLPGVIINSFTPAIINAKKINIVLYYKRLKYLLGLLVFIATLIALVLTVYSQQIIQLTYGNDFLKAGNILKVLSWTNIMVFFSSGWNIWMIIENRTKITLFFQFSKTLLNIFFDIFFINNIGLIGAAYAILISTLIVHIVFPIFIKSQRTAINMLFKMPLI